MEKRLGVDEEVLGMEETVLKVKEIMKVEEGDVEAEEEVECRR